MVEDNSINQKRALHILEKPGYASDIADNGRLALEALGRQTYDLILMDIQMPDMDGFETTRLIRAHEPSNGAPPRQNPQQRNGKNRTPIIAMTAHAMAGDREKCLDAGMDDYVAKPIQPDILKGKIAHWITETTKKEGLLR